MQYQAFGPFCLLISVCNNGSEFYFMRDKIKEPTGKVVASDLYIAIGIPVRFSILHE